MLSKAAEQCTEYLIKYNKITEQQKAFINMDLNSLYPQLCVLELFWFAEYWGIREGGNHIFYCLYSDTNHCRRLSCRLLWEMLYNDKCDSGRMHHDSGMDALYWE